MYVRVCGSCVCVCDASVLVAVSFSTFMNARTAQQCAYICMYMHVMFVCKYGYHNCPCVCVRIRACIFSYLIGADAEEALNASEARVEIQLLYVLVHLRHVVFTAARMLHIRAHLNITNTRKGQMKLGSSMYKVHVYTNVHICLWPQHI